jgi:predicted alpha/beta-hydrolase family hydrolase
MDNVIWQRPADAHACYVFAHGAGAGMRHSFMSSLADRLVERGTAVLRYEFPYMTAGARRPDREPVLFQTIADAVAHAKRVAPDLPLFAGGKSMGGRMTSRAVAAQAVSGIRGLAFVGFPLHPPKRVATERAVHLNDVALPMLFLQGTRDELADLDSMQRVIADLGDRATLHVVDGADHAFHVLKRSGRTDAEVLDELAETMTDWVRGLQ